MESSSTAIILLHIASEYALYSAFIIFCVAMIGNVINLLTFIHLKPFRNNSCIFYLILETISNILYHLCQLTSTILTLVHGSDFARISFVWCRLRNVLIQSTGLCTFYLIALAAIDQFCLTYYQRDFKRICTVKVARYLASSIILIWIIHSIIFCYYFNIVPSIGCIVSDPILVRYGTFFFYPILVGFLPIVLASSFSLMAFRNVRRIVRRQLPIQRRRLDRQITAMILVRVVFFVCSTTPFVIFRIYTTNAIITRENPLQFAIIQLTQAIISSLISLNYTMNFYIFIATSSRYRRQVKSVLMRKFWELCKFRLSTRGNLVNPENPMPNILNDDLE